MFSDPLTSRAYLRQFPRAHSSNTSTKLYTRYTKPRIISRTFVKPRTTFSFFIIIIMRTIFSGQLLRKCLWRRSFYNACKASDNFLYGGVFVPGGRIGHAFRDEKKNQRTPLPRGVL